MSITRITTATADTGNFGNNSHGDVSNQGNNNDRNTDNPGNSAAMLASVTKVIINLRRPSCKFPVFLSDFDQI